MMRCVKCGRTLLRAAATIPAVESGPTPHPAGHVGPTCARRAGLLPASLFTRRRGTVATTSRRRARRDNSANSQMELTTA